jgi:hypothetical protein
VGDENGTSGVLAPVSFTANDGVRWTVREVGHDATDERPDGRSSLLFESDATIRRVRTFPPDWRELDARALVALSWKI